MHVIGPFRFNATQGLQANSRISSGTPGASGNQPTTGMSRPQSTVDQLDLSPEGLAASSSTATSAPATVGGDMRLDKIADLRRQIAAGTYDTPERFEEAFGRMLDSFG